MTPVRRALFAEGLRGNRVNGFAQTLPSGAKVVTVEWREPNRRSQSFPLTAEGRRLARAFAKGTADRLAARGAPHAPRLTITELHALYIKAHEHVIRPRTMTGYRARWGIVAGIIGEREYADLVTPESLDDVRDRLRKTIRRTGRPMAPNQIRETLAHVCTIWRWAARRKLLKNNPLADYENKMGKDAGALEIPEYTPDEYAAIIAALDPNGARGWRAYGVIALAGLTGKRESALLQLTWETVDLEARVIHWPKGTDKLGEAWDQPMSDDTVALLASLATWRETIGYTGPYVFPAAHADSRTPHYTADSVIKALHAAEQRAGVASVKYRALHSIKRYVVRSLHDALGGDLMRVGRYVGNKSLNVMRKSYLRARAGELQQAADALQIPRTKAETPSPDANERQTTPTAAKSPSRKPR